MRPGLWILLLAAPLVPAGTSAQIATDGTVGPRASLSGDEVRIGAELGATSGGNLFHSFDRFGVRAGQTATFTGPDSVRSVVGRVTGGAPSRIDGTLRSTVGQADLYLINPAGIAFGPGARLDVPGAFHAGTAHEIRFADGARFSAVDPAGGALSVAPVAAFGFLGPSGRVEVRGSELRPGPGRALTLAGGDLDVSGAPGLLGGSGGDVDLVSVAGAGRVGIGGGASPGVPGGRVRIADGVRVEAGGDAGGSVRIRGGELEIEGASVSSDNLGDRPSAAGVRLEAGRVRIDRGTVSARAHGRGRGASVEVRAGEIAILNGGTVATDAVSAGPGGGVTVEAGSLLVDGGGLPGPTGVLSDTQGAGAAGAVAVRAGRARLLRGGEIRSVSFSAGAAGPVAVEAGTVLVDGGFAGVQTGIDSDAQSGGAAGIVFVRAGDLRLFGGGQVRSNAFGEGDAGAVLVEAGTLVVDGGGRPGPTGILSDTGGGGNGGLVAVRAADARVFDGGQIRSVSFSAGAAGPVAVEADALLVDGRLSEVATSINSDAEAAGPAGFVFVKAGDLRLVGGGQVRSDTRGAAPAGAVAVQAGDLLVSGATGEGRIFSGVSSEAKSGSTGPAGLVSVEAGTVRIEGGGQVTSSTYGAGDAQDVLVRADRLSVDGQGLPAPAFTGVFSDAVAGTGNRAGRVRVEAGTVELLGGGYVSSDTYAGGSAGPVEVRAGTLLIAQGGSDRFTGISSAALAGSTGPAGRVFVQAAELRLLGGGEIRSATFAAGPAGPVEVEAGLLTVDGLGTGLTASVNSDARSGSTGPAGPVQVRASDLRLLGGGEIRSDTRGPGAAGPVLVRAGEFLISGAAAEGRLYSGVSSEALSEATGPAGRVEVEAGTLRILGGGRITSSTFGQGDARDVVVRADRLTVDGQGLAAPFFTGIFSDAVAGTGNRAGSVRVEAGTVELLEGGYVSSDTYAGAAAGSVVVEAGSLLADGRGGPRFTGVSSDSLTNATGPAGSVFVRAADLRLANGGAISSDTLGVAGAGAVRVEAASLLISGTANEGRTFSGVSSEARSGSTGPAGRVEIEAGTMRIEGGGQVTSSTYGAGDARDVVVGADRLTVDGQGLSSPFFTGIFSDAVTGTGNRAGRVEVEAGSIELLGGGYVSSDTYAGGSAGSVEVRAGSLLVDGRDGALFTGVATNARSGSTGPAGSVFVQAEDLRVTGGGEIGSSTAAAGDAGTVVVEAGSLSVSGGPGVESRIASMAEAGGAGGSVRIHARSMVLAPGGAVTAESLGTGPGGEVVVEVDDRAMVDGGLIRTETATADGGDITIKVGRLFALRDGTIATSAAGGEGAGGNIAIDPPFVVLDGGRIEANAKRGVGGAITIQADQLIRSPDAVIEASSEESVSGTITLAAPNTTVGNGLVAPPEALLDPGSILDERCAARGARPASSLTLGGAGLPPDPAVRLPSVAPLGPAAAGGDGPAPTAAAPGAPGCR